LEKNFLKSGNSSVFIAFLKQIIRKNAKRVITLDRKRGLRNMRLGKETEEGKLAISWRSILFKK